MPTISRCGLRSIFVPAVCAGWHGFSAAGPWPARRDGYPRLRFGLGLGGGRCGTAVSAVRVGTASATVPRTDLTEMRSGATVTARRTCYDGNMGRRSALGVWVSETERLAISVIGLIPGSPVSPVIPRQSNLRRMPTVEPGFEERWGGRPRASGERTCAGKGRVCGRIDVVVLSLAGLQWASRSRRWTNRCLRRPPEYWEKRPAEAVEPFEEQGASYIERDYAPFVETTVSEPGVGSLHIRPDPHHSELYSRMV